MKTRRAFASALAVVALLSGLVACSSKPTSYPNPDSLQQAVEAATEVTLRHCDASSTTVPFRGAEVVIPQFSCIISLFPAAPSRSQAGIYLSTLPAGTSEAAIAELQRHFTDRITPKAGVESRGSYGVYGANWFVWSEIGRQSDYEDATLYTGMVAAQLVLMQTIATKLGGTPVPG